MVKAVALSTIHICRHPAEVADNGKIIKRPVIDIIEPGSSFTVDAKTLQALESRGDARRTGRSDDTSRSEDKEPSDGGSGSGTGE